MVIGLIGLGRMGLSVACRLLKAGHSVVGYDSSEEAREEAIKLGAEVVDNITQMSEKIIWLMVPADKVDDVINELNPSEGIIIDGGNSNFKDTKRRYDELKIKGISYIDCGTSGGLAGKKIGFSLMIGGDEEVYKELEPLFKAIAASDGYGYMGPSGAGHYVKMVHNGIEYALLQSYAEGFHLLKDGEYNDLDFQKISKVWNNGGVIRSWILKLLEDIFEEDQNLESVSGEIEENKTGYWTVLEAKKQGVSVELIEKSLEIRAMSRKTGGNYGTKIVAMLRNKFGGHRVKKK